jgi:DNA-binding transcriptional regulator YhcF (GntR family)
VLNLIAEENLKKGSRIPPERELIERCGCSRITIRKALDEMTREGLLERRIGSGTFLRKTITSSQRKTGYILLICLTPHIDNNIRFEQQKILREYFEERGMNMKVVYTDVLDHLDHQILEEAQGALGIMLFGWVTEILMEKLKVLTQAKIIVGNVKPIKGVPQITYDMENCATVVTREMLRNGAKKILLLNGADKYYPAIEFEKGFRKTITEAKSSVTKYNCIRVPVQNRAEFIDSILSSLNEYDGVLFDLGVYVSFLAAAFVRRYVFNGYAGFFPVHNHGNDRLITSITRTGGKTFAGVITESVFLKAAEALVGHISENKPLTSIRLKSCVIDKGNNQESEKVARTF